MFARSLSVFIFLSVLIFAGCAPKPPLKPQDNYQAPYTLAAGDVIKLASAQDQSLNGTYTLDSNGDADLPLIGRVNLNGLTIGQSDQLLTELYANGYLVNPDISVQMDQYRPFYIMGEVENPGKYEYEDGLTILNAVAIAGGFKFRADQEAFELVRKTGPYDDMDAPRVVVTGLSTSVMPGDTIYVKKKIF